MKYIICDIDGTIAEPGDRLKYLKESPPNWDKFYEDCFDDEVINNIQALVWQFLEYPGYEIVYCTGRRESVRDKTEEWLMVHEFDNLGEIDLLMRPNNDHRHDTIVKPELLADRGINPDDVLFILEDRNSMVEKWRELGFTCLQVREGDF